MATHVTSNAIDVSVFRWRGNAVFSFETSPWGITCLRFMFWGEQRLCSHVCRVYFEVQMAAHFRYTTVLPYYFIVIFLNLIAGINRTKTAGESLHPKTSLLDSEAKYHSILHVLNLYTPRGQYYCSMVGERHPIHQTLISKKVLSSHMPKCNQTHDVCSAG